MSIYITSIVLLGLSSCKAPNSLHTCVMVLNPFADVRAFLGHIEQRSSPRVTVACLGCLGTGHLFYRG